MKIETQPGGVRRPRCTVERLMRSVGLQGAVLVANAEPPCCANDVHSICWRF